MTVLVILCRHGNTFEKGDKVVMVGSKEDLPLTPEGRMQADRIGKALCASKVKPTRVLCGPLQRTRVFAERVVAEIGGGLTPLVDQRLLELDYGAWGGLSDKEIADQYGEEALHAWQERGVRPAGVLFAPAEEVVDAESRALLEQLVALGGSSLVVTSNGRLRDFGRILGAVVNGAAKVKTGHACILLHDNNAWRVLGWNLSPEQLTSALTSYNATPYS